MKALPLTPLPLLLVCSPAHPASAQEAGAQGRAWEEAECPFDTSGLDAARLRCGYLTVPENRQSGSARTLRIAVAVMKAQAPSPERGTGYSDPEMCASLAATNRYIAALDLSEEEAALSGTRRGRPLPNSVRSRARSRCSWSPADSIL